MSIQPKVSIITPSYNQAIYLEDTINSVLNQDYPNIEYIIMDGGSTDGSVEIIQKYSHCLAYWVSQKDGGQSAAINEGLRHSTGEIWAWMNADDAYLPGAISKAVEWLSNHSTCDILCGDCIWIDEKGREQQYFHAHGFDLTGMLANGIDIPSGSTFIRKAASDRIGKFDEALHYVLDSEYWLRAVQVNMFGYIPEALSLYRVYPAAKTWDVMQSEKRGQEIVKMYERFWLQVDFPQSIAYLRNQSLSNAYLYAADLALQAGNRNSCVSYIKKSLPLGIATLRPRLVRILIHLGLGVGAVNILRKLLHRAA